MLLQWAIETSNGDRFLIGFLFERIMSRTPIGM